MVKDEMNPTTMPDSVEDQLVCARLRTKGGWVPYGERVNWGSGFVSNAIFWCLDTAEPVGPDDHFAHPHVCITGRLCYCEISGNRVVDND